MMSKSKVVFNKAKQRWKRAKEETDYKEEQRRQSKKEKRKITSFGLVVNLVLRKK